MLSMGEGGSEGKREKQRETYSLYVLHMIIGSNELEMHQTAEHNRHKRD